MRRLVATLGLVAVLGLTGCGGDSDDEDAAPPTTVRVSTTAAVGNDQAGTPFCGIARTLEPRLTALVANLNDKTKLRAATTDAESTISQAQSTAPAKIKSDVTTVATTASQVLTALRRNDFDVAKTPEFSKLQEPAFQASFTKVNAYVRAHCGVA